jgi:thiamine pyrophosphate-dependent acetolactate synthase large subunit-like protein
VVPFVRPETTHEPATPAIAHVAPPGDASTVCDVAGHTSSASATVTLTDPSPTTTLGAAGTLGFAIGVTDADGSDAAEVPPALLAVAVNV